MQNLSKKMVLGLPLYIGCIPEFDGLHVACEFQSLTTKSKSNKIIQIFKSYSYYIHIIQKSKSSNQTKSTSYMNASLAHWKFIFFCPVAAFSTGCGSWSTSSSCSTKCPTRMDAFASSIWPVKGHFNGWFHSFSVSLYWTVRNVAALLLVQVNRLNVRWQEHIRN